MPRMVQDGQKRVEQEEQRITDTDIYTHSVVFEHPTAISGTIRSQSGPSICTPCSVVGHETVYIGYCANVHAFLLNVFD